MDALRRFSIAVCFVAVACRNAPALTEPPAARGAANATIVRHPPIHADVAPIPGLGTGARVRVVAEHATDIVVRYGPRATYGAETPTIAVTAAGLASTTIVGLAAGATSHVEVTARYADGSAGTSGDLTVTTPPLEPDVPTELDVSANSRLGTGVLVLAMNPVTGGDGFTVMADRSGRIIWYRRFGGGAFALDGLPSGHLVLHQSNKEAFDEIELDGTVIRSWQDDKGSGTTDGHDIQLLPNGNALVLGIEAHAVDSRRLFAGGVASAIRLDATLSETTPDGAIAWRWSTWSRISEAEMTTDPTKPLDPTYYEVVHANSIEPMPDGDILVSLRNIGSVVKLGRQTGEIVWRLGGTRSDFRIKGDPLGGFYRQHDARLVGPNRILLFDNGNQHEPAESRVVEYRLDPEAKTATMVWQFRRSPALFARVSGSVQRLSNGNTLVSWGPRGVVTEVDPSGVIVWEAKTPGFGVYRARVIATLSR